MSTPAQIAVLLHLRDAAKASDHIWPSFAACEGVLESAWGTSQLYRQANNVFGQKQSTATAEFPTLALPTREFIQGKFVTVQANWVNFPTLAESFAARMQLLKDDAAKYPNYAAALEAETGADFVTWVSKTWSTDPNRGKLVLEIYDAHRGELG
jgi:flagellar protein FlgJ